MNTFLSLVKTVPYLFAVIVLIPLCAFKAARAADRKRWDQALAASVLLIPLTFFVQEVVSHLSLIVPLKADSYAFWLDSWFGNPSFVLGRFLTRHLLIREVARQAYNNLALAIFGTYVLVLWRGTLDQATAVFKAISINLLFSIPFYLQFPVCRPKYAFKEFPNLPAHFTLGMMTIDAPPNGVPSVHTSSALLICWFARHSRVGSMLAAVYLALMILATMGFGEHYFVDLIAAVPYSLLILWLSDWNFGLKQAPADNEAAPEVTK